MLDFPYIHIIYYWYFQQKHSCEKSRNLALQTFLHGTYNNIKAAYMFKYVSDKLGELSCQGEEIF